VPEYGGSQPVMSRCGGGSRWDGWRNVAPALVDLALLLLIVGCVSGEQKHSASDAASPLTAAGLLADAALAHAGQDVRHGVVARAHTLTIAKAMPLKTDGTQVPGLVDL